MTESEISIARQDLKDALNEVYALQNEINLQKLTISDGKQYLFNIYFRALSFVIKQSCLNVL